jgi:hypothetical protein
VPFVPLHDIAERLRPVRTCEVDRLLAAGRRAVEVPDALADPAEVMLQGRIE